jgi:MFS transporter, DHA2 family, multidrug resistance protein
MAIFGMGVMVGPTLGPTLGGWITDNYSWPWIFYINLPLGILAAMMTWRFVPEPSHPNTQTDHVDWLGLALLIAGIGSLQIMLERGESKGWMDSREIRVEAILAAASLISFVWHELTTEHPVVDLRILRNRQLAAGVVFGLVLGFALYASVFALPVFLQTLRGYSAWDTGRVILPGAIASAITMAFSGRLSGKMDARYLIVTGVGLFFWAMWLHSHFTLDIGMHDLLLPMILRGIGLGLIFVPLTQVAVADLRPQQLAQGTGLFNLSRQLGGSFGIAVAATLLSRFSEQSREGLRAHLNPAEPAMATWLQAATLRMQQLGGTLQEAQLRAYRLLDLRLDAQASVIAFEKVFLIMGLTFVVALPLLLAFRTGRTQGGPPAH